VHARRARLTYGVAAVRDAQPGDPPLLRFWHEGRQRWCVKGAFHRLVAAGELLEPAKVGRVSIVLAMAYGQLTKVAWHYRITCLPVTMLQ
jgi:hypothetical protein